MPVEYAYICHRLLGDPTAMLAKILAIAVGSGSFILFMAAFFFPEVYRKGDFIWSGVGIFYAIVLWFCAGQATGAELLGETASVVLIWSLGGQLLVLRRQKTPSDQQTPTEAIASSLTPKDEQTPAPDNVDLNHEEAAPKANPDDGVELTPENAVSDLEPTTDLTTESTTEPAAESTTESTTESAAESTTESTTESAAESTTEPATESTTESATESATESTTESATEPAAESITEPPIEPAQTSQRNGIFGSIGSFFGRTANSSNVSAEETVATPGEDSDPLEDWGDDDLADNSEDSTVIEANTAEASDSVTDADESPASDAETPIATDAEVSPSSETEVNPATETPTESENAMDAEPDTETIAAEPANLDSDRGETDHAAIATETPIEEPDTQDEAKS